MPNTKELLERGALEVVDPLVKRIIDEEGARQDHKLILIASESICPKAVRQALASPFSNIYAEGYAGLRMANDDEESLADLSSQLAHFARLSDRRYYRGCEYADVVEALARRRVAELFANDRVPAERIFANVQPLSGAAANNAVYDAFVEPGGTVLGMALSSGGHLTHGSPVNRSGKHFRIVSYGVTGQGQLDYDGLRAVALAERPRLIIAGFSAYPWDLDWPRLRSIADEAGATLCADIAHTAGLVVGGVVSSPVGHAHVVSFTTHKTMCGPRGAVILTTDAERARKVDFAVFPGEQGGPHINSIAAKAVSFRLAATDSFKALQRRVVENARALAEAFKDEGLPLAYGGTNTHMVLIDCAKIKTASGEGTSGELLARLLDAVGVVVNKNTIAGDASAVYPSAVRFGATWVSQRGLGPADMKDLAAAVARTARATWAFRYHGGIARGRIDFKELEAIRDGVAKIVARARPVEEPALPSPSEYPYLLPGGARGTAEHLLVRGRRALDFLHAATTGDLLGLSEGQGRMARVLDPQGEPIATVAAVALPKERGHQRALLHLRSGEAGRLLAWLRALSDGTARFDDDLYRKVPGPVTVEALEAGDPLVAAWTPALAAADGEGPRAAAKGFFVGERAVIEASRAPALPEYAWERPASEPRRTPMYEWHQAHASKGQIANFAGWLMPVYFKGIREEHQAVRGAAGLFDVAHMGVLEVAGRGAERFLDLATVNSVSRLRPGRAHYSYLLGPDGHVIDDILIYRRAEELFMVVVNASNADEDEAWLRAVLERRARIDLRNPGRALEVDATLRNLKDPSSGDERRVDTALQGPRSLDILLELVADSALRDKVRALRPFEFAEGELADIPAVISRTGYTGEPRSFELYVHPEAQAELWQTLLRVGERHGIEPAGLGARDSTRTEAGLPLHGHELAGGHGVNPFEAGYGSFVKLHKPWFIGRDAMVEAHRKPLRRIVRFEVADGGGRMLRPGAPVVDSKRGKVVGTVTSCAKVEEVQVGMALCQASIDVPGTKLDIFPIPPKVPPAKKVDDLADGDAVALARQATVLERFRRVV
jgi:glycine hydroxymethyltransferase